MGELRKGKELGQNVGELLLALYVKWLYKSLFELVSHNVKVDFQVFGALMEHRIFGDTYSCLVITV